MGTFARRRPSRLAEKLLRVRQTFGDSQNGLIRRLGLTEKVNQSDISAFERGAREPPLYVLLKYSEAARVWVNAFIDDNVELPERIPCRTMSEGIRRKVSSRIKN
jgi:transcriptional regulator with XRE-family HTH domain